MNEETPTVAPKTGNNTRGNNNNRKDGATDNVTTKAQVPTVTTGSPENTGNGASNGDKRRQRRNRNTKKVTTGNEGNSVPSENVEVSNDPSTAAGTNVPTNNGNGKKGPPSRRNRRNGRQAAPSNSADGGDTKTEDNKTEPTGPEKADDASPPATEATKRTPLERRRLKRTNQRLRKIQARENATKDSGASTAEAAAVSNGTSEGETNAAPAAEGAGKNGRMKKGGRNTESFDPASSLVRPSLRVNVAPGSAKSYGKPLKHDDVIIVPELFGAEGDLSVFDKLVEEISQLQKDEVKGAEWTPWHQGAHMIAKDPKGSKTFQEVVDKLCEYFHVKKDTIFTRLNWYKDSKDWKPFHHDAAAFNKQRAKTQNITVGVSFGACRELAFLKTKGAEDQGDDCRIYFPQPNNGCFTFGRDVNINFKHGINALPESEHDGKGRISILLWGWTENVIEEGGSPAMIGDASAATEATARPSKTMEASSKALERKKAQNERRKTKRKAQQLRKKQERTAARQAIKEMANEDAAAMETANGTLTKEDSHDEIIEA